MRFQSSYPMPASLRQFSQTSASQSDCVQSLSQYLSLSRTRRTPVDSLLCPAPFFDENSPLTSQSQFSFSQPVYKSNESTISGIPPSSINLLPQSQRLHFSGSSRSKAASHVAGPMYSGPTSAHEDLSSVTLATRLDAVVDVSKQTQDQVRGSRDVLVGHIADSSAAVDRRFKALESAVSTASADMQNTIEVFCKSQRDDSQASASRETLDKLSANLTTTLSSVVGDLRELKDDISEITSLLHGVTKSITTSNAANERSRAEAESAVLAAVSAVSADLTANLQREVQTIATSANAPFFSIHERISALETNLMSAVTALRAAIPTQHHAVDLAASAPCAAVVRNSLHVVNPAFPSTNTASVTAMPSAPAVASSHLCTAATAFDEDW